MKFKVVTGLVHSVCLDNNDDLFVCGTVAGLHGTREGWGKGHALESY